MTIEKKLKSLFIASIIMFMVATFLNENNVQMMFLGVMLLCQNEIHYIDVEKQLKGAENGNNESI